MYVRFLYFRDFLANHRAEYHKVLITDVRDVFFQANPFFGFTGGLMVFEEDGNIPLANSILYNALWVEKLFGSAALAKIGRFPVICAGTTMGDIESMCRYLQEFEALMRQAKTIDICGSDQGIHNYLCRRAMKPWIIVRNIPQGADGGIKLVGSPVN
jgi:hypothetical protein